MADRDIERLELLEAVRDGRLDPGAALEALRGLGQRAEDDQLIDARPDIGRLARTGFPEAVYGAGKSPRQVADIAALLIREGGPLIVTRATLEQHEAVLDQGIEATWHATARMITRPAPNGAPSQGLVVVASAGTTDLPVAEEAAVTAECLGATVDRIYDVGVAGLHRLTERRERLAQAYAVVVCAGMDGALASVVGGLVGVPVIAVPTSVGYGAVLGGIGPLLAMLSSCAPGVTVVNIDNGFGAGFAAARINRVATSRAAADSLETR